MITVAAPAKVNLHLAVGDVRPDGYHHLTGVFHTLEFADEITIEPADRFIFRCDCELGIPAEKNLAHRAAVQFAAAVEKQPDVAITLAKRIPHGAGLGGGSSDAAAVIAGLSELWGIEPSDPRRVAVAQGLGADVAFFLEPSGAALMTRRGDVVARRLPALAGAPIALVRPPEPVSTAAAYAAFDADPVGVAPPDAVIAALETSDAEALAAELFNNLENASSAVVPAVADALAWVRAQPGVAGAAVAGSGSAVFALVCDGRHALDVQQAAEKQGFWAVATRLGSSGVAVRCEG